MNFRMHFKLMSKAEINTDLIMCCLMIIKLIRMSLSTQGKKTLVLISKKLKLTIMNRLFTQTRYFIREINQMANLNYSGHC